jgi:trypsin-like peptidase
MVWTRGPMGFELGNVILPVIVLDPDTLQIHAVCGTGFILAGQLFVTCWHCVMDSPRPGLRYAAALALKDDYRLVELKDLERDRNGTDLALARVPDEYPSEELILGGVEVHEGMDVGTYGYALPEVVPGHDKNGKTFVANPRTLRGYITRAFPHERPGWNPTPSYELDMPTPEGLSGAPLMATREPYVIGVIYGTYGAYMIEEMATVDEAGVRRPEVRRMYTFGLALMLDALEAATAAATDGLTVRQYVSRANGERH